MGNFTVCFFYQKTYFLVLKILQKYVLVLALTLYVLDHDRLLPLLTKKRRVVKNKTQKKKDSEEKTIKKVEGGVRNGRRVYFHDFCVCVYTCLRVHACLRESCMNACLKRRARTCKRERERWDWVEEA